MMIGKTIGNYKIIKQLGTGGMGTVYLAENISIGTLVAVKALHQHLFQNNTIRKRFLKEAKTQAILSHPNITKVVDYIDNKLGLFIILEYIKGEDLNNYIFKKRGLLPEEEANEFMVQILEAVGYAHSKGVIHRDLKSANIRITPDKKIKIMDFGIAKLAGESLSLTKTGSKIGSPLYMSPEQVTSGSVDHRSDIYSLGVVYHEMLTGKPVYDQNNTTEFEVYEKIVRQPLPRLTSFYKYTSIYAQNVVDKATSKLPEARYQTCEEFIHDLLNPSRGKIHSKKNKSGVWKPVLFILLGLLFLGGVGYGGYTYFNKYKLEKKIAYTNLRKQADKYFIKHEYNNAYKSYKELVNNFSSNLNDENNKISNLVKLSNDFSNKKIVETYQKHLGISSVQIAKIKDSLFREQFLQKEEHIRNDLKSVKNNKKVITEHSKLESEIENIKVLGLFAIALNLEEKGEKTAALDKLSKINNLEKYPSILSFKNDLFPKEIIIENTEQLATIDSVASEKTPTQKTTKEVYNLELVDTPPRLLKCKKKNNVKQIKCIKERLAQYIEERANKVLYKSLGLKKTRIPIAFGFEINEMGEINTIQVKSEHQSIEYDIYNIIKTISNVKPALKDGNNVSINYKGNLILYIKEKKKQNTQTPKKKKEALPVSIPNPKEEEDVFNEVRIPPNLTIQMVDRAPIFPGCEGETSIALIRCTSNRINEFIESNIDHEKLKGKGLQTGKITSIISFKINTQGRVNSIRVNCTEKLVKDEIYRVVNGLPKMSPALYENIQVGINHKLTLTLNITKEYE